MIKLLNYIYQVLIDIRDKHINFNNRKRLLNKDVTLICSNCAGGIMYHWLGLKFNSPFINLFMTNEDFLTAMENFDEFIGGEIKELKSDEYNYPLGQGVHGEILHFMHYKSFKEACEKWNERKLRINPNNMAVMLTNLGCCREDMNQRGGNIYNSAV